MNEDCISYMIVKDDVADILDQGYTHERLISELKEYFNLNDEYHEERAMANEVVQRAIAAEKAENN